MVEIQDQGLQMTVGAFSVRGAIGEAEAHVLVQFVVEALGMTSAGEPVIYHYPTGDGKGGVGFTLIHPFTESFVAVDAWPAFDGAYLIVCSCVPFSSTVLQQAVRSVGLAVVESAVNDLSLCTPARPTEDGSR